MCFCGLINHVKPCGSEPSLGCTFEWVEIGLIPYSGVPPMGDKTIGVNLFKSQFLLAESKLNHMISHVLLAFCGLKPPFYWLTHHFFAVHHGPLPPFPPRLRPSLVLPSSRCWRRHPARSGEWEPRPGARVPWSAGILQGYNVVPPR